MAGVIVSSGLADVVTSSGRIRGGVRAGSLELGGQRFADAERLLTQRARLLAARPVAFTADGQTLTVAPDEVAFFPDVDATLDRAKRSGRSGNIVVRVWQALRSYVASTDVGWEAQVDRRSSRAIVDGWAERFDTSGHEAAIRATSDGSIEAIDPEPGRRLDKDAAVRAIASALQTWPRRNVPMPFSVRGRRTDAADAESAAQRANVLVQAPVTLLSPTGALELEPPDLARLLEAVPRRRLGGWSLDVRFSPDLVRSGLGPRMKEFERPSKDATFNVSGAVVTVSPSQDGLQFDGEKTAQALDDVAATAPPRATDAAFTVEHPKLTTESAKGLNIHEQVSTFTTRHPAGAPRVRNIHLIADTVDGTIVKPGESFSLNRAAGERTAAKGYVLAPMIYDGEFKDQIGGGVSQFATTMFNAVFFGGHQFESYKAHSYYISRYPPGREATVSWPAPDLKWKNTSPAGVLIKTSYTAGSITVTLYGDRAGTTVAAQAEDPTNVTPIPDKRVPDPTLPPGTEKVTQEGEEGFDIVVWRVITKDGKSRRQRFFTRYQPEPRIIAYGEGSPAPGGPASPGPQAPATPQPPATPAATASQRPSSPTPKSPLQ